MSFNSYTLTLCTTTMAKSWRIWKIVYTGTLIMIWVVILMLDLSCYFSAWFSYFNAWFGYFNAWFSYFDAWFCYFNAWLGLLNTYWRFHWIINVSQASRRDTINSHQHSLKIKTSFVLKSTINSKEINFLCLKSC